jgi:aryl-alcohol dehydrogenase-like predicted oxidoreductase
MDYINLGKTGLKVSRLSLGCMSYGVPPAGPLRPGSHAWALNEADSQPFFKQALDLGINFFDTANIYTVGSSEELLGRFLKANTKREDTVIATKLRYSSNSTKASNAWAPTTSTSTRSTAGTTRPPSKRPWKPSTTS